MTMRVYVLYPHNRSVLIPLFVLWLGIITVGCVRVLPHWRIACPMTDKATKKWAVFSSSDTSSDSTDFVPSAQLMGNIGCPSGSYTSSEQWVICCVMCVT